MVFIRQSEDWSRRPSDPRERSIKLWAIRELSRINFCSDKNFPRPRLACPCEGMAPTFKSLRKSKQLLLLIARKKIRPSGRIFIVGDKGFEPLTFAV